MVDRKYRIIGFDLAHYAESFALWQRCEGIGLSQADRVEHIARYLDRNPGMSFLATTASDAVIGTVLAGHDGRRGFMHHLAVDPAYRRLGLGRQLATEALNALAREGIGKCHLFIYEDNAAGIRFWEATGWTQRTEIAILSRDLDPACGGDC